MSILYPGVEPVSTDATSVPDLPASKITSGQFTEARLPVRSGSTQVLTASSTISVTGGVRDQVIEISSAGTITLTSVPTIQTSGVTVNQLIVLVNVGSFAITLQSKLNLASSAINTDQNITLNPGRSTTLMYSSALGAWVQIISRSALSLGTLSLQDATTVAITGGAIDGTPIGATTASTVRASQITVAGASGTTKDVRWFGTTALWNLYANSTAESGNSGSDLVLSRYGSTGYLGDVFLVNRNTGAMTFYNSNTFSASQTFSAGLSSAGSISVTGQQVALAPTSPSAGGGFRYDYTAGASIAAVFVGGGANLQFGLAAPASPQAVIFNSGSSLGLQVGTDGVAKGNVYIGTNVAVSSTDRLQVNGNIASNAIVRVGSYTVATVPSAVSAGGMIYVSNESGGATVAFSDGTNWRRVHDRAIIS